MNTEELIKNDVVIKKLAGREEIGWINKKEIKRIEKIYIYHLTRYYGKYEKCLPLGKLLVTQN